MFEPSCIRCAMAGRRGAGTALSLFLPIFYADVLMQVMSVNRIIAKIRSKSLVARLLIPAMISLGLVSGCITVADRPASSTDFGARIANADAEPGNWLSYGRDYAETRDSPLDQINDGNVRRLGLTGYYDLDTNRGQETTPLAVDGVLYTTSAWSKVQAFDGVSGKLLWQYDPKVPGQAAVNACCDVVNRGAAYWDGRVLVGTIDGRLIALDARTGTPVWSTMTVAAGAKNTITGAPRVVKGLVIIGNGGAEQGARGYVSAYEASTGKLAWRFYTVPGEPGKKDGAASDAVLDRLASKTWAGKWWTQDAGMGGGTVWDAITYDPDTNLLFIGVGNGSLWNRKLRSDGKGDNLFLASIVALKPETGEYVWHYQQVPGDEWDYTATQQITLADLNIGGRKRKVLMQAPKNGFFYILDRKTGELLSAEPYAKVNWATHVDLKTGRPNIVPEARWSENGKPFLSWPNGGGAHNWHPMAYSKKTGLIYIPVQDLPNIWVADPNHKRMPLGLNVGYDPLAMQAPTDPQVFAEARRLLTGHLLAWDPLKQKEVWRASHSFIPNGGVLSTAGNLVFQGDSEGVLAAYDARNGKRLWAYNAITPILAPPMTWAIGGRQYVTVVVGWGGSTPLVMGAFALDANGRMRPTKSRVLTFALDGKGTLPAADNPSTVKPTPPPPFGDATMIARGQWAYHRTCVPCHGMNAISASVIPDLRHSPAAGDAETWKSVVIDGVLTENGMVSFKANYSPADAEAIRAYVVAQANLEAR
jgi:quinohemoprotein ethanol dehydrogenase